METKLTASEIETLKWMAILAELKIKELQKNKSYRIFIKRIS